MAAERRRARVLRGPEADAIGRATMSADLGLDGPGGFHGDQARFVVRPKVPFGAKAE